MGEIYCFTRSHDKPGSQLNRQPRSSSTKEAFTLIAVKAEVFKSLSLARMYKVRAMSEAVATIAEEFMLAALEQYDK